MNYFSFDVTAPQYSTENNEILMAVLGDLPFDTFEETETGIRAYMPERDWNEAVETQLNALADTFEFTYEKTFIAYQNWNEIWESNFQPIQVDDFVAVRADFHPPTEGVVFDLVINPKMAFGTGHHETTYQMMQLMRGVDFNGKKVLDYGCGTGILAILASKLHAVDLEAVDIEPPSYDNTVENCVINDVHNVEAFCGTLETIPSRDFDVILANINRNVILESLPELHNRLTPNGLLLISGFLKEDETVMNEATSAQNFRLLTTTQRGNWLCQVLQKR